MTGDANEHPDPERWWRHRRWMGWYGVAGATGSVIVGVVVTVLVDAKTAEALRPLFSLSVWSHLTLTLLYQGGASLVDAVARLRHGGNGNDAGGPPR